MSYPQSKTPESHYTGFVEGAVLAIVVPVFQYIIISFAAVVRDVSTTESSTAYIGLLTGTLGGFPALMTLAGLLYATVRGRLLGLVGFLLGTGGANRLWTAPQQAVVLMMIGAVLITVGIALNR